MRLDSPAPSLFSLVLPQRPAVCLQAQPVPAARGARHQALRLWPARVGHAVRASLRPLLLPTRDRCVERRRGCAAREAHAQGRARVAGQRWWSRAHRPPPPPHHIPPAAAGLEPDGTPYLCGMDSIGAQVRRDTGRGRVDAAGRRCRRLLLLWPGSHLPSNPDPSRPSLSSFPSPPAPQETAKDFMVAGTATDSLLGICESLWRPDLVRGLGPQRLGLAPRCTAAA